jgi:cathepsin L
MLNYLLLEVLVVGYGVDPEEGPFWIIKNEWGRNWGDGGYMLMQRGQKKCSIAELASYPCAKASEC